jgi:phosphoglycolate phosphatase
MNNNKTILWDWNGTLLNDIHICIDAINVLLRERNKTEINEEIYREIFTFPVRDYYIEAGFDFSEEPFEKPALEFIENYEEMVRDSDLFEDVIETLEAFRALGYKQMILSAMHQDLLNELVEKRGIAHFFEHISGIDDHYAAGKVEYGRRLLEKLDSAANQIILIGDTMHDYEVGSELGIETILVSRGHQSEHRLKGCKCKIVANMKEVRELIIEK